MKHPIDEQLRCYARGVVAGLTPVTAAEASTTRLQPIEAARRRPAWLITAAAVGATLVVGIVLALVIPRLQSESPQPMPPATTTALEQTSTTIEQTTTTVPATTTTTTPAGVTWTRIPHDDTVFGGPDNQAMNAVVAGGPGLVAVGYDGPVGDGDAAVWTSPDGVTWTRIPHDDTIFGGPDIQGMAGVAAGGPGLVAVGYDDSRSGRRRIRRFGWRQGCGGVDVA